MAQTFQDNMKQDWALALTLSKVRTIRDKRLGLDLLNPQDYLRVMSSLTDRLAFVWCLCEEQASELEIDVDEFEERLYGGTFASDASIAFIRECSDFTRKMGQETLARLAAKQVDAIGAAKLKADQRIESGQLDQDLEEAQAEMMQILQLGGG